MDITSLRTKSSRKIIYIFLENVTTSNVFSLDLFGYAKALLICCVDPYNFAKQIYSAKLL